jgi:hypothetical protein
MKPAKETRSGWSDLKKSIWHVSDTGATDDLLILKAFLKKYIPDDTLDQVINAVGNAVVTILAATTVNGLLELDMTKTKESSTSLLCSGKLQKDVSLRFSSPVPFMSEQVQQAANNFIHSVCTDFKGRMMEGGEVWEMHFAKHIRNMQLVLQVIQTHETQLFKKIQEAKAELEKELLVASK